ncbi:beta-1,3-galactosyltransferase brn [Anthonomus grandis grandis]|uniref:beta-1,3-galactosyltransferase brn n=1 Tax=Anthonomus grandis grandis TaxID=2921223 RepID=UPI0021656BDA|nr:beta-1,3-galactosyltransferase brn [Anthonomus grandis grandis]
MYPIRFFTWKKLKLILFTTLLFFLLVVFGVFHHPLEKNFYTDFKYPFDGDIERLVLKLKSNQTPEVPIINSYNFTFYKSCDNKCRGVSHLQLVYIIKSASKHFQRRLAIRRSWGFQRRFSDVEIRTVFLIGITNDNTINKSVEEESQKYSDIVLANYVDTYFNNTYKTMSGFEWAMKHCSKSKFYMFVDDDYYVSTKNLLRFLRFPTNYPGYLKEPLGSFRNLIRKPQGLNVIEFELDDDVRLYTGYAFKSAPHRHYFSKWYISLEEYPYHLWPPYVSAGAYVLSNAALKDMYYASFYTKHFRFDDIYVGILAYKTNIEPLHSEEFAFNKKPYSPLNYQYLVSSHGYGNPEEMVSVWNQQKSLGHA